MALVPELVCASNQQAFAKRDSPQMASVSKLIATRDDLESFSASSPYLGSQSSNERSEDSFNGTDLRTDTERLWREIHYTAQWGGIPDSYGMARLALSDADKLVRDYFVHQAIEIGCEVKTDEMGNIFAILAGENNDVAPIGIGSHLDTQPAGT